MKLSNLIPADQILEWKGDVDPEVKGVHWNASLIRPGDVFCTWKGEKTDGHQYISQAWAAGAVAVVSERLVDAPVRLTQVRVKKPRATLSHMGDRWFNHPSQKLKVVGITGTNGKTSTSYLLQHLLQFCGRKAGLIGTIENRWMDKAVPANRTTPEGWELQQLLHQMSLDGCDSVVMEVSSHALDQGRTEGVRFELAIFTNLTVDHLDYHGDMESYFQAKSLLFCGSNAAKVAVIQIDDSYGQRLARRCKGQVITYGFSSGANSRAEVIELSADRSVFSWKVDDQSHVISISWVGQYNVLNTLAALTAAHLLECPITDLICACERAPAVQGRLERVDSNKPFAVFVDYAHTPDALRQVLGTLRPLTRGKLRVLVGCGGNRDKSKRPLMASIAQEFSDHAVFTSDNPRDEDPQSILHDMLQGLRENNHVQTCLDRREAIEMMISQAEPGDVVLLAGKGHESYQEIRGIRYPFSDREIARSFLEKVQP